MNRSKSRHLIHAVCASLTLMAALPGSAHAQGWIVGASVGAAKQHDYDIGAPIANPDDTDTAFRLFGGYQISPMQAVIASFVDLGKARYSGPSLGGFSDSLDADGIDVSYVVGWTPGEQNRVAVFGTVGVLSWDQDVSLTDAAIDFQAHDEGTSFSFGFGAEVNLSADGSSPWGVHFDYQIFKDVGSEDNSGQELDRDSISVGVSYRFGDAR